MAPAGAERDWIWALVLLAAVFLAYTPVWRAGFIWDDDMHVTANPVIVGPLGLKEIWTTNHARICPLALTTFWFEHALWGLAPLPYHLVNVLVHGLGAVVLWRVLRQLQIPGAWFGAALWALHPVQVETVAWITELKNTQSCLFYLLSILFFVKWLRAGKTGGNWPYALTLLFAAMAMASKSSTVILPLVLCLCAWWVEGRWQWRRLIAIAPIFLMSVAAAPRLDVDAKAGRRRRTDRSAQLAGAADHGRRRGLVLPRQTRVAAPADFYLSALADRRGRGAVVSAAGSGDHRRDYFLDEARDVGSAMFFCARLFCRRVAAGARIGRSLFPALLLCRRPFSIPGQHRTARAGRRGVWLGWQRSFLPESRGCKRVFAPR